MRNFFNLVKIQFLSYFGINKLLHSKKRTKIAGGLLLITVALIFAAALIWFGYTYSDIFATALVVYGNVLEVIPIMLSISGLVCFFFAFYSTSNVLYCFKDYDMVSAMPIKTRVVVLSKLVYIYVADVLFMALISIPSLFVYVKNGGAADLALVVRTSLLIISLPAFSLSLAVIVGTLVSLASARFRRKNVVQIILLFAFFIGIFMISFLSGSGEMINIGESIGEIYFIYPSVVKAVSDSGVAAALCAGCIALAAAVTFAVCIGYKRMNTMLASRRTVGKFRLKNYSWQSQSKCFLKKEVGRLFSVPTYAVNALFGCVMSLIAAVALAWVCARVDGAKEGIKVLIVFTPSLYAFMHMLSPTTSCSVSLEGKSIWLIKTLPVNLNNYLGAKLGVNALFNALSAFVSSLIISIAASLSVPQAALVIIVAVTAALSGGNIGLLFDLKFPTLKWESENKPVKQGTAMFLSMLTAFVLSIVFFLISCYSGLSVVAVLGVSASVTVILAVTTFILVFTEGKKLINRIDG